MYLDRFLSSQFLEGNKSFFYDLVFDILTDLSDSPFSLFKHILKNMKDI